MSSMHVVLPGMQTEQSTRGEERFNDLRTMLFDPQSIQQDDGMGAGYLLMQARRI